MYVWVVALSVYDTDTLPAQVNMYILWFSLQILPIILIIKSIALDLSPLCK